MLNKNKIYRRDCWLLGNKYLAFAWNDEYKYFAYISNLEKIKKGTKNDKEIIINFTDAYNMENSVKPSKVGDRVLNSTDIKEIDGIELVHFRRANGKYLLKAKKTNQKNKEKKMNKNYVGTYGLVKVAFINRIGEDTSMHAGYIFKIDPKLLKKIKVDDLLVVDSENGLGVVKVVKKFEERITQETIEASNKAKAWVVDKIDTKTHMERIEATERKKFIMEELKHRKEEIEEKAVWKMLAENDSTAKKLLEELEKIEKGE